MAVTVDNTKGAYTIPALSGSGYVPIGGGTMTGALTIASGTLTASAPALSITQTWNSGATIFTAFKVNATSTASSASSKLIDLQTDSATVFSVNKQGSFSSSGAGVVAGTMYSFNAGTVDVFASDFGVSAYAGYGINFNIGTARKARINPSGNFELYQLFTDASNYERLTLTGVAGTSVNLTAETLGTGADNLDIVLTPAGAGSFKVPGNAGSGVSLNWYQFGARLSSGAEFVWTSGFTNASVDTGFRRNAAGIVEVNNGTIGTYRDLKLRNLLQTAYQEVTEMTAPSAPERDSVRIYAEDNGSGKTRLMALFATGAAQQLAIEP